jgi:hypothetical protein
VVHAEDDSARERDAARGRAVSAALTHAAGEHEVAAQIAGAAQPVVDPRGKHRARNERVEIVFVTREAL